MHAFPDIRGSTELSLPAKDRPFDSSRPRDDRIEAIRVEAIRVEAVA